MLRSQGLEALGEANPMHAICFILGLLLTGPVLWDCPDGPLRAEARVEQTDFCSQPKGGLMLRLVVRVRFENIGGKPLIIPRFFRVSGYSLFKGQRSAEMDQPEQRVTFRKAHIVDTTKLDHSAPNPELFDTLGPHGTVGRVLEVPILLRPAINAGASLFGKDHYARIEIDEWPDDRATGEELRQKWSEHGLLWIDKVALPLTKIHIDQDPTGRACGQVD